MACFQEARLANDHKRIEWLLLCVTSPDGVELNDWEHKFVESVEKQFKQRGTLSDGQYEKLEQVYERLTQ